MKEKLEKIINKDEDLQTNLNLISDFLKENYDIDEDDTLFVALANHLEARLWTGDRTLEKGLEKKGYGQIIKTPELYDIFMRKELKRGKL